MTFYDLELGAKFVYPVLTPLRNAIPRVSGRGGLAANWRSVTAINTQNMRFGVSAANRGGVLAVATQDYSAAYKGIGVETSVDFEAQYAGQGFDDVRAVAAKTGLESLMLGEEAMILGGCACDARSARRRRPPSERRRHGRLARRQSRAERRSAWRSPTTA